ncbi:MAG TPA: pentapeptide repeat-containing protein [Aldersonia sp.]
MTLDPTREELRPDCTACFALCCTAFGFVRSADFAIDKPAGIPCGHLAPDHSCTIHAHLRGRGFRGCLSFDCFGAGQAVSQRLFAGRSWRDHPQASRDMFASFAVMRHAHEMLWYLREAAARSYEPDSAATARHLTTTLLTLTRGTVADLLGADLEPVHAAVRALLAQVSAEVRAAHGAADVPRDPRLAPAADLAGRDLRRSELRGADLRGASLIAANLRGCDLTAADLLGADLRAADLSGADTTDALI